MARPAKHVDDRTVVATVRLTPVRKARLQQAGAAWLSWQLDLLDSPDQPAPPVMLKADFERPGPQLAKLEHGAEPSLADVIQQYYERSGIDGKTAARLRDQYIQNWLAAKAA